MELIEQARRISKLSYLEAVEEMPVIYDTYRALFKKEPCSTCGQNRLRNSLKDISAFIGKQDIIMAKDTLSKKYRFKAGHENKSVTLIQEGVNVTRHNLTDAYAKILLEDKRYKHLIEEIPGSDEPTPAPAKRKKEEPKVIEAREAKNPTDADIEGKEV